ncbi:MAG: metallophosphoesterase [Nitrospirae bacterium]|nr:metallophosphoesterase [Nitrospirota bacterium]
MKKLLRINNEYALALTLALVMFFAATSAFAGPWKFGVMSDTQWKANVDGENPETVAVGIINQLNTQFINHDVKFVIQVGDLVDKETNSPNGLPLDRTIDTRAAAAQPLYDAGIGFYPLRGNHEGSQTAAGEFQTLYTQTTGSGPHVFGAENFSSPFPNLSGLSYSFDYHNARFVILDQFTRTDGTSYLNSTNNNIIDQLGWIDARLSTRPRKAHAFVFSHKNLIGQNHTDSLFGSNPAANPDAQNAFIGSLAAHGVRYHLGGHDHVHNRSIVASPDGSAFVQDIIASSNSYKFYIPQNPSNDAKYNVPGFGFSRETPIAQELFTVGYYIFTVDGPRVTVEHYASPNGCDGDCDLVTTPTLTFTKRETFGYSLNGREFLVPQGGAYTTVEDSYHGTTAWILDGINGSTATDYASRPLTKAVDTGWTPRDLGTPKRNDDLASDILTLWGMADLGCEQTDVYTLSMSYDHHGQPPIHLGRGLFGLASRDQDGNWINAVDRNFGGAKKFVLGPWKPGYEFGTYGIDLRTHTVWAIINYNADFAVARFQQEGGEYRGEEHRQRDGHSKDRD